MTAITQYLLKELFNYNPETGIFTNKTIRSPNSQIGQKAGSVNGQGYIYIKINGTKYLAHRLAWLFMTGTWPKETIDHINRVKTNNSFSNLREASKTSQQYNTGLQTNNTSGFKGVSFAKKVNKWNAYFTFNKKATNLGYYDTPEKAANKVIIWAAQVLKEKDFYSWYEAGYGRPFSKEALV